MQLSLFQVDAFTNRLYSGNPAAVCPLSAWLADEQMQAIAAENNVSETAFYVKDGDGYQLRWFSPRSEVQLCGHATLASALIIFQFEELDATSVRFLTRSGPLVVEKHGDHLAMDFPSLPARSCSDMPSALTRAFHPSAKIVLQTGATVAERNYFLVYEQENEIRQASPDFNLLEQLHPAGVCITAPGKQVDFVSRYFVPGYGIPEDPVTGSTHCTLGPYWAERLGKRELRARQLSPRGGELLVEVRGDRVVLKGQAVLFMRGTIQV